jgi:hypothetical protein
MTTKYVKCPLCDNFFDSDEVVKFCEHNSFLSICDCHCKRFGVQRCNPSEGRDSWASPRPPVGQRVWEDSQAQFPTIDKKKERLAKKQKKEMEQWKKKEEKLKLKLEAKVQSVETAINRKKSLIPGTVFEKKQDEKTRPPPGAHTMKAKSKALWEKITKK